MDNTLLLFLCIVFFACLTYGLIQGDNLNRLHYYNCKTIYIPEDIDIETIYQEIHAMDIHQLRKRARYLGTSEGKMKILAKMNIKDEKRELKEIIISLSKRDEDIRFKKLEDEDVIKREIKRSLLQDKKKKKLTNEQKNMQDPEYKKILSSIQNSPLYSG
jgi:hypothetical protein